MHKEWLDDERPELPPFHTPLPWPLIGVALLIAAAAAYFYYELYDSLKAPAPQPAAELAAPAAPALPAAPSAPLATAPKAEPEPSLPSLDNSDSMMRDRLAALIGRQAFADYFLPVALVRRIVATVDNLPRPTAPRRMMPLAGVPGVYEPGNYDRYAPYVRIFEALDEQSLVRDYARAYPLFQRAYVELGYPDRQFNDRLVAAIDDLLSAPDLAASPELMRPKVHYEFADPDLETRSAGQKIMLRLGPDNAARVKAKLILIRREILAASAPR
ncbi:MAG TPA: DUF3014 domain-containing protein [Burkholderiales bacterium]|nr:DUF3014 domain-containing protein [Burkholderiales bacterium]